MDENDAPAQGGWKPEEFVNNGQISVRPGRIGAKKKQPCVFSATLKRTFGGTEAGQRSVGEHRGYPRHDKGAQLSLPVQCHFAKTDDDLSWSMLDGLMEAIMLNRDGQWQKACRHPYYI